MMLAVVGLVIPALYAQVTGHRHPEHIESLSLDIAVILILVYAGSLVFSLRSHRDLFAPAGLHDDPTAPHDAGARDGAGDVEHGAPWTVRRSVLILIASAALTGWVSEFLVHAVDQAGHALGVGKVFMGVVIVALIGNAAEHSTAVMMAMKGKMDLAIGIALGSSAQVALLVAPLLVIAGHIMGQPLGLEFTTLEVVAVMLSVFTVAHLIHDGKTNWFEGLQLLSIYAILAMAFYFV